MAKKIAVLLALILCFTMLSCSNITNRRRDKEVFETFLQDYYAQLTMTSSEWNEIKELLQKDSKYKKCRYVNNFNGIVSETCLERMVYNQLLPNYEMEKTGIETIAFSDLTLEKKYEGTYHDLEKDENVPFTIYEVSYILRVKKNGEVTSFANKSEVRIITKGKNRMIDNVIGDFVWR